MLTVVFLILGGILASASLIVARKPNAQELIDKITPYQGWIGVALFFWGIWDVIQLIRVIGILFKVSLFYGI
ncbi:MAG: hypothetical protein KAI47_23610, partial [Deltaproteobacteria bacterium]|nr:hypothetical protein [Deltaproteobacteria bacterium]